MQETLTALPSVSKDMWQIKSTYKLTHLDKSKS